jgi:hypothetical protein
LILVTLLLTPFAIGYSVAFADVTSISGWLLLCMVVFLAAFNVRKKLTYPPLMKASTWLQMHVYIGVLTAVVFFFHTGARLPTGALDITLYCLFIVVLITGVIGLYLTRTIPGSLSNRGNEVIFERIPAFMRETREKAKQLVLDSIVASDDGILAELHGSYLAHFFSGPRNILRHILRSDRTSRRIRHEIAESQRYLSEGDKELAGQLIDLVKLKDDLDFHYARQGLLKLWLFVHIPITVMLLIFLAAHVVLVYAFNGGASA